MRGVNFFTAVGDHYGAGVAGKGFALALAKLTDLRLYGPKPEQLNDRVQDDADAQSLINLLQGGPVPQYASFVRGGVFSQKWLCPEDYLPGKQPGPFVSHIFFECDHLKPEELQWLAQADTITTGSQWTTDILHGYGLNHAVTVYQGVDQEIFKPAPAPPDDRFVIFSGGKLEYRKGVDLTIRAFARFAARHTDAQLYLNAFNPWPWTQAGLQFANDFEFHPVTDYPADMATLLEKNGVPLEQVHIMPQSSRRQVAQAISASHCALFPIRAEGGTNHFLMEAMAGGCPVIATHVTGLKEILRPGVNSIGLEGRYAAPVIYSEPEPDRGDWLEPDVDEIVEALEDLYQNRHKTAPLAQAARQDIAAFSWPRRAEDLMQILNDAHQTKTSPD